jgi:transcription termination/antitermination protein NusA
MKGSRVQAVVQELRGEKIDIIPWNDDPAHFVCNALQPAEISKVIIDQDTATMEVVVADDQLSLAIGKKGQNVRLAARLTGWKIDVRSESKEEKITGESFERLIAIDDMDEETATILFDNGYRTPEDIAKATIAELTSFVGITEEKGRSLINGALRYLANPPEPVRKQDAKPAEELLESEDEHEGFLAEDEDEDEDEDEFDEPEQIGMAEAVAEKLAIAQTTLNETSEPSVAEEVPPKRVRRSSAEKSKEVSKDDSESVPSA